MSLLSHFFPSLFPTTADVALFDESLIPSQVQSALPLGYRLRPLRANDYERGFLKVLEVLTEVGHHTKEEWLDQFNFMKKRNDTYFTITITDDANDQIVATGTILIERKFVHKNGLVGHIEDIAVDANQQGKKLGLRIIEALKGIGASQGCYKVILDCAEKNMPFYEKCGFQPKEHQMAWYVPNQKANL
ncbi:Glucosamine-phosphate N-acetyltransferase-like protein [Apophysomyces ossiformis]|uniref:Glucosamine 6-phosphate N-acetyltransferase n=1 Tax=Apophysomyces ossiformis TaxID=679940 RepID=A0A8H7BUH2_9FUNG|nr:Glucosamine-phosphate N-acetyltransferase-like protein [Apophysomyces ossiformis]